MTVLFAWELGANFGHLAKNLALAPGFIDRGMDVVMAVPNPVAAGRIVRNETIRIIEVPQLSRTSLHKTAPINHADLLLGAGWSNAEAFRRAVGEWRELLRAWKVDRLVYDHAPTALVAAYLEGIQVDFVGSAFELPPLHVSLPSFRPWVAAPTAVQAAAERMALNVLNRAIGSGGGRRLHRLVELYQIGPHHLTTFPQIDPFGSRPYAHYIGPIGMLPGGRAIEWKTRTDRHPNTRKILIYLRANPRTALVLQHLQQLTDADVVCCIPDAPDDWAGRFDKLRLTNEHLQFEPLLAEADLVITHGTTTMARALWAGTPVLALPEWVEQYLVGSRIERLGFGKVLRPSQGDAILVDTIRTILNDPRYQMKAAIFPEQHTTWALDQGFTLS